jgi:hypothetical protein
MKMILAVLFPDTKRQQQKPKRRVKNTRLCYIPGWQGALVSVAHLVLLSPHIVLERWEVHFKPIFLAVEAFLHSSLFKT